MRPEGTVAPGFEPVAEAFRANFERRGEIGASLCVIRRGEVVVDQWGGWADREAARPWTADTPMLVFSATKGVMAACFLLLSSRGQLDLDAPVAAYWPEFGANGKADITVRTLLNHRAGLIGVDADITLDDFEAGRAGALAADQAPCWEPGSNQGYHGVTIGIYGAELFQRVAGESMGAFFQREIAAPLGADVHLGTPQAVIDVMGTLYPSTKWTLLTKMIPRLAFSRAQEGRVYRAAVRRSSLTRQAFRNPSDMAGTKAAAQYAAPRVLKLELPWANAVATARGLARMYAGLIGAAPGHPALVPPAAIAPLRERQSWVERDAVLHKPLGFSQCFQKEETKLFSPNPASFGHPGAGGSLGWCDPDEGLAIAYVMNRMDFRIRSPRALALSRAVYGCLG